MVLQVLDTGGLAQDGKNSIQGVVGDRVLVKQRFLVRIEGIGFGFVFILIGAEIHAHHAVLHGWLDCGSRKRWKFLASRSLSI